MRASEKRKYKKIGLMSSDQEVITNYDLVKNIKLHKYYHIWFKEKEK